MDHFVENPVKNHGENFGKWYSLSKSVQLNRSTIMDPFFLKMGTGSVEVGAVHHRYKPKVRPPYTNIILYFRLCNNVLNLTILCI